VPSWQEVQRLYPEYLPDDAALKAAEDAERGEMKRLRQELPTAAYRVPGRRGKASVVAYDPARINIEAALVEKFGAGYPSGRGRLARGWLIRRIVVYTLGDIWPCATEDDLCV
jgi:hypothetical protein